MLASAPLARRVLTALAARGLTLATAESLTGGLLAGDLVSVPGASRRFLGGIVAYTPTAKERLLGIDSALLDREGIVSGPVALAMAHAVRGRLGADLAVALTGLAGPAGDPAGRHPVGTVFAGLALPTADEVVCRTFDGPRIRVCHWAVWWALTLLLVRIEALTGLRRT